MNELKPSTMTDDEAIKGLQNIVEYWTLHPHEQECAETAISALRERIERRNPQPLTPETEQSKPDNTTAAANPYWQRVCAIADKQRAKGIAEYGQGLEDNPADIARRITYLEEEMVDGLMYCEWIKDRLQEVHHGT